MSVARIKEILSWYPNLTLQQQQNFLRIVNYGRLAGTGKFVILPVDQGYEHGPGRSFQPNPVGYDPRYHAMLAVKSGCNAYAAPVGALEAAIDIIKEHELPTILKVNSHDMMMDDKGNPFPAITSWVDDAVRLGCAAVGYAIYPGSSGSREMYQQVKELRVDSEKAGLILVLWAYPRGSGLPTPEDLPKSMGEGISQGNIEVAVDAVAYAVHIACQLGAHIIKCKPTLPLVVLPDHIKNKTYDGVPIDTLADRTQLVIQSAFDGHRVVINSGGAAKGTEEILNEVRELNAGGSFGSIVGRNSFQRPKDEGIALLREIQNIYMPRA
ncbi:MAG: class I fructose-bisphosphate aldolase [Parcubacteria group bacterium]|nr:class I fructose-bisphosphate aldolase [Parcubacteria group bacterium]